MKITDSSWISPEACRAARALLSWSMRDLAGAADLSLDAILNLERPGSSARRETYKKVRDAFEAAGVSLIVQRTRSGAVIAHAQRVGEGRGEV